MPVKTTPAGSPAVNHSAQRANLFGELAERVMARADQLATYSEASDRLTRRFLTPPMHDVHETIDFWMESIAMSPHVDNGGNLIGRRPAVMATANLATPSLLIGSHLDTVPNAGKYDGVLGVLLGLAVCEALGDRTLPFHVDVLGFSEEEGVRYRLPYLGSAAVAGVFDPLWLARTDEGGVSMRDAIANFGLDPECIATAAYDPAHVIGFIEPHLEQGPVLERTGLPVGVVSGIAGQSRLQLEFLGQAGHAGTTPMAGRSDAVVIAAQFAVAVQSLGKNTPGLVATVGCFDVAPNASNVIPGQVCVSLDVRHIDDAVREQAVTDLLTAAMQIARDHDGTFSVLDQNTHAAVDFEPRLTDALSSAIEQCGHEKHALPSGAGHDAAIMAARFPTAMLFLRHPSGVSHHPDERADVADVAVAIEVLTTFVLQLAENYQPVSNEQSLS